ncbi:MAG: 5-bromo-4-chloroindolyl phosphate hydrolysis family protein [Clostridia bacterium]|nr:5-bromo-4-chloroindolyl phosphate hydrolysis family protein [Clostridia bacterium]
MAYKPKKDKIPGWLIFVGFMIGFWPGGILLAIRMIQEAEEKDNGKARRTDSEWEQNAREASRQSRTYNAQGQRTYQPPKADAAREERTIQGSMNADGTYRYSYSQPRTTAAGRPVSKRTTVKPPPSLLQDKRLSAKIGRGLKLAGNIVLGVGAFTTAITFLGLLASGSWFFDTILPTSIVALCCCTPGVVLSVIGSKKHSRVMRCRTYAAMIGSRRSVSIDDLAAAIPTGYNKCVDDLQWMLGEGLLQGMYIDGSSRTLTYPDAGEAEKTAARQQPQPAQTAHGEFPEVERIRALNSHITDDYVSQRMDRLEELTQKILSYAQEHPEKEPNLRQFRNHYLPKTFSILESYARMERMGVEGGNIGSAMKDVEDIMDKLVLGFEKQLDALFDSEALDVTTDVSVLENMMTMEGLSDLDPFGAASRRDAGETWTKQ